MKIFNNISLRKLYRNIKKNIRRNVFNFCFVYVFEKMKIKLEKYICSIWIKYSYGFERKNRY